MLHAILSAGGAIMWSMSILVAVLFIISNIMTQAATSYIIAQGEEDSAWACKRTDEFFGSVGNSLVTMFLSVTGGVNWGEPLKCVASIHWGYAVVFFVSVAFCLIAMLGIVNGFFVESAMQAAKADREHKVAQVAKNRQKYMDELRRVFKLMDNDGTNGITYDEFKRCVDSPQFQDYLAAFDLDIDAGTEIFNLLDEDGNGVVEFEEFVQGCMKFRGQASAMDVASLRQDMKRLARRMTKVLSGEPGGMESRASTNTFRDFPTGSFDVAVLPQARQSAVASSERRSAQEVFHVLSSPLAIVRV